MMTLKQVRGLDTATGYKFGQTVRSTKDNGLRTELVEKAFSGMLMVIFLKGSLRMINQTALGSTHVPMELDMRACGLTTYRTVKAKLFGQTLQHIQEITFKAENTVLVLTNGLKATLTAGSGKIIRLVDLAPMNGLMAEGMKDTGRTT